MDTLLQWIFIALIIIFIIWRFLPVRGVKNISIRETKDKIQNKKAQFIDVRTPGEYNTFHHRPFQNIPLASLTDQIQSLNKDEAVILICQSGMRSMRAARILKKQGFNDISNVKGGMSAWI